MSTDILNALLKEHTRCSQALLGHETAKIVADIDKRYEALLDNERRIRDYITELLADCQDQ